MVEPNPTERDRSEAAERSRLDRALAVGIAWTGGIKWVSQLLSWVGTVIVARLLVPEDFGILGMATFVLGFMNLVNEFGIGAAIVQRKEISEELVSNLGGFSIVLGIILTITAVLLSMAVATFFNEPRVQFVIVALATNFFIGSFRVVPRSLLARDMRFRLLAGVDGVQAIATTVLTVVLAWMGFAYWSLVAGSVFSMVGSTLVLFHLRPFRPSWPKRFKDISRELEFGWNVVASQIAWYTYSNADFAVVGRVLGTAALGAYNIGWTLASVPVDKISGVVTRVTPPIFARVQDRPEELRRYLKAITEAVSMVTFPAGVGLALVAESFVSVLLGETWLPAVVPLQILALYGGFRSVTPFFAQLLVSIDRARMSMWFSILAAVLLVPAFVVGARWGTTGVAVAWVVVYPAVTIAFHLPTTFRYIDMSVGSYLASLWPALSGCAVMTVATLAVRSALQADAPPWLGLTAEALAGGATYGAVIYLLHRDRITTAMQFFRRDGGSQ